MDIDGSQKNEDWASWPLGIANGLVSRRLILCTCSKSHFDVNRCGGLETSSYG